MSGTASIDAIGAGIMLQMNAMTALTHIGVAQRIIEAGNTIGLFPEGRRVEAWGVDAPKRGAAWLAWMTGAPLVPVTIHGTQDSLSPETRGFVRTAVRIWIDEPIQWFDYADRIDPIASMMDDWYEVVNGHLEPWSSNVR